MELFCLLGFLIHLSNTHHRSSRLDQFYAVSLGFNAADTLPLGWQLLLARHTLWLLIRIILL